MSTALQCSSCNELLPDGVPAGLCPSCVAGLLTDALQRHAPPKRWKWPRRFGEYELLEKFGMGGMGIVYKARQRQHDRVVALKMIRRDQIGGEHEIQRFRSEAEAVARLDHPHIIPLYEVGEHCGRHFFSMLLIESGSLMTHQPRLSKDQRKSAQILATVARAVHYAHQHGILHRDLKPANILLDAEDQPYVSDFGLAKNLDDQFSMTQTGAVLGTPSYMAPEQAAGKHGKGSPAADVYSLGAILYELLTGQPPFAAETPLATLKQLQEQEPRPPCSINRKVHRDLETICLKCLQKDPQSRYPTAEALARDLESFLREEPIDARPISHFTGLFKWARRRPVVAGTIAMAAVLLVAVTIASLSLAIGNANARDRAEEKVRDQKVLGPNVPPVVVLMDARAENAVYDPDIFKNHGTNADVLTHVLDGMGLKLLPEPLSFGWHNEKRILDLHPDLVLIHRSGHFHEMNGDLENGGFNWENPKHGIQPEEHWQRLYDIADDKLIAFIGLIGTECLHTKFVVYSRGTDIHWQDSDWRKEWVDKVSERFPRLHKDRIRTMLIEEGKIGKTFRDPLNADEIRTLVQELLHLDKKSP